MSGLMRRNDFAFPTISRLFDDFFGNELMDWNNRNFSRTGTSLPAVNVRENDDNYTVEVAAPGMKREDFNVQVHQNVLTISSEKREERNQNGENGRYSRREFSYQSFSRSFSLPDTVDAEHIEGRYEDGVLHLVIPKKEEAKPKPVRRIEIA